MPAIFVHGVPDTSRVWHRVVARIERTDTVVLDLPGFGTPTPPGFQPTKEGYVDWLLRELARHPAPIDLIGHDWGALLVVRAVSLQPDLVRSWAAGGAPLDPEYEWHKTARLWQTPDVGERLMESMSAESLALGLVKTGVPAEDAADTASRVDSTMKACILALYRSAVDVGREWAPDLARVTAPGLVLWGENDPYAASRFGDRLAERTRARSVVLPGCAHWWQLERPDAVARELRTLWAVSARARSAAPSAHSRCARAYRDAADGAHAPDEPA
jgi:pimeloyl-ACP methyl ester carboxylesterase